MSRLENLISLVKRLGIDAIMLTSEINMHYAVKFPRLEGMILVTADGSGVCFTDSRYIEAVTNHITPMGFQAIEPEGSYPTPATIRDYVMAKGIKSLGIEDMRMSLAEYRRYQDILPCELVPIGEGIESLRRIKEPWEVECIVKAQRIAEEALTKLLPDIKPGAYEDELAAKLKYYMSMGGSDAFDQGVILISGTTTSLPHGEPTHKAVQDGDFVMIDYGPTVEGYYSDMTRTFGVGHISQKMRDIYQIVLEAQLAGIDAFECGKKCTEVDAAARKVIEKAGYGAYFGHGLGHSIGLEIHENPRANRTYEGRYQLHDITTIEPGIYLPGEFGVRIEDMIYLGEDGKRNLTAFPKELMVL